ncbi:hypothetical protein [Candidatus Parabeggiatoa sp. HSG14]|uniref:hypothetical protein n=1 Tax=Candidatus Parabeggiatoa sp. HSG14 TaxID=3055593 RepID=UPI0025A83243|nr:hypothetical protein [Thiotrichales bacterium HSG14]
MNQEQLNTLQATFQKLFEATTPLESITVLQQHPELLSEEADMMLDKLIHHSREQGNEVVVQLFNQHREILKSVREGIAQEKIPIYYE